MSRSSSSRKRSTSAGRRSPFRRSTVAAICSRLYATVPLINGAYRERCAIIIGLFFFNNFFMPGISLRKVEKGQQREVDKGRIDGLHDVASILARRVAMEISDSESASDSEASDWDDETR